MKASLTEEELGRVGLCSHFGLDCLCDNWNMVEASVAKKSRPQFAILQQEV